MLVFYAVVTLLFAILCTIRSNTRFGYYILATLFLLYLVAYFIEENLTVVSHALYSVSALLWVGYYFYYPIKKT